MTITGLAIRKYTTVFVLVAFIVIMGMASYFSLPREATPDIKIPYMIVVPKGIAWPPAKKDDKAIYKDMLKLGCQLKSCNLKFGDGTGAKIKVPIK